MVVAIAGEVHTPVIVRLPPIDSTKIWPSKDVDPSTRKSASKASLLGLSSGALAL
jgi:hypothetical protein